MYKALTFGILFAIWIVFSGQFDLFHLGLGLISAGFVTYFSGDFFFEDKTLPFQTRLREAMQIPRFLGWLIYQITLANLHVMRLALSPKGLEDVDPEIVTFKTALKSDFAKFVLANSITLTPGTVTVKVDGDTLHVHAISRQTAEDLERVMEQWLRGLFEKMEGQQ